MGTAIRSIYNGTKIKEKTLGIEWTILERENINKKIKKWNKTLICSYCKNSVTKKRRKNHMDGNENIIKVKQSRCLKDMVVVLTAINFIAKIHKKTEIVTKQHKKDKKNEETE